MALCYVFLWCKDKRYFSLCKYMFDYFYRMRLIDLYIFEFSYPRPSAEWINVDRFNCAIERLGLIIRCISWPKLTSQMA